MADAVQRSARLSWLGAPSEGCWLSAATVAKMRIEDAAAAAVVGGRQAVGCCKCAGMAMQAGINSFAGFAASKEVDCRSEPGLALLLAGAALAGRAARLDEAQRTRGS